MSDQSGLKGFTLNTVVINAIVQSVEHCFSMCELKTRVMGLSKIPIALPKAAITGIVGMNGKCTGFLTLSLPERVATLAVSGMLQDEFSKLNNQVLDGIGEMTNIICGGVKTRLYNSAWMVDSITIPSVILGENYNIAHSKGIEFLSVTFEIDDPDTLMTHDRVFMVTTSLMQLS